MAKAQPALVLGHQHAGEAHFRKLLPQVARKAGCVLAVAQAAQMRDRRGFGEEWRRAVLEHRLIFGVIEGHVFRPVSCSSSPPSQG
jgi:hypothetical protein